MPLSTGTKVGPYEILGPLGAGGMGEVYRARDTRLGRDVAVKVLPASFAADPERLRRFETEARTTGMLNHPNILAVYDIGAHEGSPYLVTELLEGQTLRELMPPPRRKAIEYARQICEGLAAAHSKGVTHRDLKPDNLFVTTDGRVKILDFGLAKVVEDENLAATKTSATTPGVALGTVGYMSPEQVKGLTADARSDIFSFGAVLYEMLTGQRAFQRDTAAESMTAILKDDPPPAADLPPALQQVLHRCLEKSPEERFHSARDLAFSLGTLSGSESAQRPAIHVGRSPLWTVVPLLVIGALAAGYFAGRNWKAAPAAATEVRVQRLTDFQGMEEYPALSPDGKSVAFVADTGGRRQVWVRLIAGGPALQLTHEDADHQYPRWTPDSGSLIYFSPPSGEEKEGTIWQVSALGGAPRRVAGGIGGADISHDGSKVALFQFRDNQTKLVILSTDGSPVREVASLDPAIHYLYPRWSPDDRSIAFEKGESLAGFTYDIAIVAAEGGPVRPVTNDHIILHGLAWLPDGSGLVFSSARNSPQLYIQTFDLWQTGLKGEPPRQLTFGGNSWVDPDVGAHGEVVASRVNTQVNLWKYPADGAPRENTRRGVQITRQTGVVLTPSAGPGGKEIVYLSDSGGHSNLWISNLATGEARQITFEQDPKVNHGVPVWSPDGRNIVFVSTRGNDGWNVGLWQVRPDGSNLHEIAKRGGWAAWSADSKWIYSITAAQEGRTAVSKFPVDGGSPVIVRDDAVGRLCPGLDGQTLYYVDEQSKLSGGAGVEIRVASPEGAPGKPLAMLGAARIPDWGFFHPVISGDGKWLAFSLKDGLTDNLWAISTADGHFRQITEFRPRRVSMARRVSWSSDGRFIFAAVAESESDVVLLTGLKY